MIEHLTEAIAEIVYDNDMDSQGYEEWVIWDFLDPGTKEDFLKVAEEIVELIEEEIDRL